MGGDDRSQPGAIDERDLAQVQDHKTGARKCIAQTHGEMLNGSDIQLAAQTEVGRTFRTVLGHATKERWLLSQRRLRQRLWLGHTASEITVDISEVS